MAGSIFYDFEVTIKPGQLENFKILMKDMVEATWANEPRTLGYEWCISSDGKTCHTYERYVDSAAALTHLKSVGEKFSARYFEAVEAKHLVVCGSPDDELKAIFDRLNAVYLTPAAGFTR
jgi:quinol monooxygenase YgiN